MRSLLASRFCVHRRVIPKTQASRQWQRASISFWHYIRQEEPHGQSKFLNYEDLVVPDIASQEISLWSGEEHLGLIPVQEVIDDHLGTGTMLSLRGDPPRKKSRAAPESYDYEVRRLKTTTSKHSKHKFARLWLDAFTRPSGLQHLLELAYRFLRPDARPLRVPVEFHIGAHPLPGLTGMSQFTWGRVDLHPSVILRALPEGSFQVVKPKVHPGVEALWVIAPRKFSLGSVKLPDDPHDVASMVEKVVVRKREWLKELIDAGDLTPNGNLTIKGKFNPRQKFGLNKQCLEAQRLGQESEEKLKE